MTVIILESEDNISVYESLDGMFKDIQDTYGDLFEISIDKKNRTISLLIDGESEGTLYYWETDVIKQTEISKTTCFSKGIMI